MIKTMLISSILLFAVAIAIAFYQMIKGPSPHDRIISMDFIGVNLISGIAVICVLFKTHAYIEVILVLGILAFISTIAFSKFFERGVIIERKRDH